MKRNLSRLFRPSSIAVVGGGAWCQQIILQTKKMGFSGRIHFVHPKEIEIEGIKAFANLASLPEAPDAVFVGVNRHTTISVIRELADMNAGGAVCFASGFSEAAAEDGDGQGLQAQLVEAAGNMPILGPNCYGFINALDGALLWPDQQGCAQVDRGVAILTQSSNIAINLTMQQRGLPIAYVVACGNMAQTTQAEVALALLEDPRVTAIGLHIEGFADIGIWHELALKAAEKNIPLIALKVGKSDQAQQAAVSHTASLAGSDAGAAALLARLGIGRVHDLPTFLETLKLLHCSGPLDAPTLSSISCSGGEASLAADTAQSTALTFPALTQAQRGALAEALGPMVALSNPLDYHTYIWRDAAKMADAWAPMAADHIGLTLLIVDYPHTDASDWECATLAALEVRKRTGRPVAMVATLPELMPQDVAERLMAGGVTPMHGLTEAIAAAQIAATMVAPLAEPPLAAGMDRETELVVEAQAKARLAGFGVDVPKGGSGEAGDLSKIAQELNGPFVIKTTGFAHKSEAGGVRLNVSVQDIPEVTAQMPDGPFLIEEMAQGGVAEVLIGVTRDPAHGFVLTVGAGGVLTELWQDTQSLLIPASDDNVLAALKRLRIWPLLQGYRGKPAAHLPSLLAAIKGVQDHVIAHSDTISEVEINPLICTPDRAIAVDALIHATPDKG